MCINNSYKYFLFIIVLFFFNSCRKYETLKDTDVVFYGHKGGGSNVYNEKFMENTVPSFKETIQLLDGIEFDIQLSLDGTIWLYHNHDLNDKSCHPAQAPRYIPLMTDEEIAANMLCEFGKTDRIYKFSEVIELWNNHSRSFPITIDIKISFPREILAEMGGKETYYTNLAQAVADDVKQAENTNLISFEFFDVFFLNELKKHEVTKDMKMFFSGDEDFQGHMRRALSGGYDGISLNFKHATKELIEEANEKGLLVQIWTVYYKDEIAKCLEMSPDFIHTDNIYSKNLMRLR